MPGGVAPAPEAQSSPRRSAIPADPRRRRTGSPPDAGARDPPAGLRMRCLGRGDRPGGAAIGQLAVEALGARRSALGARRSALGARRSALGARRSALGARRSALGARRSALGARRSALGARRSALGARRSALGARRSALGAIVRQAGAFCNVNPLLLPPTTIPSVLLQDWNRDADAPGRRMEDPRSHGPDNLARRSRDVNSTTAPVGYAIFVLCQRPAHAMANCPADGVEGRMATPSRQRGILQLLISNNLLGACAVEVSRQRNFQRDRKVARGACDASRQRDHGFSGGATARDSAAAGGAPAARASSAVHSSGRPSPRFAEIGSTGCASAFSCARSAA